MRGQPGCSQHTVKLDAGRQTSDELSMSRTSPTSTPPTSPLRRSQASRRDMLLRPLLRLPVAVPPRCRPRSLLSVQLRRPLATTSDKPHTTSDDKKYSKTLLLPRTSLPQRSPDAKALRERFGARTTGGLYRAQRERDGGKDFVFLDGPPYANGDLHMGES